MQCICDCIAAANSPEFIRAKNEEYTLKIVRQHKEWGKFTKEERSWLRCRFAVELLKDLRYVGQLPPCCRVPIIVDQDFQYLYQGLRVDPNLIKRMSKGT